MKIRIVTGNKGGVGKSFLSIMFVDYLMRHDKAFLVGDAEAATVQATTWNVMRRHVDESVIRPWQLGNTAGFEALADEIERNADQDVTAIIDTGASMMDALAENLAFLSEVSSDLGADVGVVFVSGPLPDSVAAAREYLRAQKLLEKPVPTTFLLTSPTERLQDKYAITHDEAIQKAIPTLNGRTAFLGPVRQEYFDDVMKNFRLPGVVLKDPETGYGYRKKLDMWLKAEFDGIASEIMGE